MEDLHHKYLENKLTPDELIELREELDRLPGREVESRMEKEWVESAIDAKQVPAEKIEQIRGRLAAGLRPVKTTSLFIRVMRVAAILLIPLLMMTTYYFYRTSTVVAVNDMVVTAGKGERVSLVLPDGTKVKINALSTLSYNPVEFNKRNRTVRFEGEAFFEVTRNEKVPFFISTTDMELEVLGTTFNLQARDYEENIEVSLVNGRVLLRSLLSQSKQELFENQKALFCKGTGTFTVIKFSEQIQVPWLTDAIVFKNKPLEEVVKVIETNYDVTFRFIGCDTIGQDLFTGTLPAKDLDEVLEILRQSYGFVYEKEGQVIQVSPSKQIKPVFK